MASAVPQIALPRLDSPRFKANPYPIYARLRAEAPVYRARVAFWFPAIWIVTPYEDVVRVLKDQRFSKDYARKFLWMPRSARTMYRNLLTIDPPDHTRLRSLVQKAFTPRLIEGLRDRIQRICDELLDRAAGSDTIELIEAYALPVPLTIISDLPGIPIQDRHRFGPWAKRVAVAGSPIPKHSTLPASPTSTLLLERVCTSASVHRWPVWKARSPSRHCFAAFPDLHLAVPPDSLRWRRSLALRSLIELPVRTAH